MECIVRFTLIRCLVLWLHLLRSHGSLEQPRASNKSSLSEPTLDDWYFFHAKFQTSTPLCFIAVQYTTSFWFGDMLWTS